MAGAGGRSCAGRGKLAAAIRARLAPGGSTPPIDATETSVLRSWLSWASARFEAPGGDRRLRSNPHGAWLLRCGAGGDGRGTADGPGARRRQARLHNFEHATGSLGVTGQAQPRRSYRIPAPLDFAGMPNPAFLDVRGSVGAIRHPRCAGATGRGSLTRDAHGARLCVELQRRLVSRADDARCLDDFRSHSRRGDGCVRRRHFRESAGWPLESFRLDTTASLPGLSRVYLAAGPAQAVEGLPLEEVHFLPDEVANVECGPSSESYLNLWAAVARFQSRRPRRPRTYRWTGLDVDAARTSGKLVSASARRHRPSRARCPVVSARPTSGWTAAHRTAASRQALHQEEVPAEGAQVTRRWQSARGIDGSLHF